MIGSSAWLRRFALSILVAVFPLEKLSGQAILVTQRQLSSPNSVIVIPSPEIGLPNPAMQVVSGLPASSFSVTATDANGCPGAQSYSIQIAESCPETSPICEFSLPTENARPTGIVAGPDGNLWFTEVFAGKIGRITPYGEISEFETPTGAQALTDMTSGPDGNIWFTEQLLLYDSRGRPNGVAAENVGRITPSGVVSEFKLDFIPNAIASGSDGNLWVTTSFDFPVPVVFRITPAGIVSGTFGPVIGVFDIASGPDGALWVTGFNGGNGVIVRLTTSGSQTQYSVSLNPTAIAAGPDGALWITESSGSENKIGRITTAGVVTEFSISGHAHDIVAGADGNLWFSESDATGVWGIGRVTPLGSVTEFVLRTDGAQIGGLASTPNGNLWFTEPDANKVGRIPLPIDRERLLHTPPGRRPRTVIPR